MRGGNNYYVLRHKISMHSQDRNEIKATARKMSGRGEGACVVLVTSISFTCTVMVIANLVQVPWRGGGGGGGGGEG